MKQKKEYKVVNERGLLTRKEVGMMTGWGQTYIHVLVKDGRLVPSAPSYYGTLQLFSRKDVERCRKQVAVHPWDNRKGAVNKKVKKRKESNA